MSIDSSSLLHDGPSCFTKDLYSSAKNERTLGDTPNSSLYQVEISGWRWPIFSEPIIAHYNQMTLLIVRDSCWFKPPLRLLGHILFIVMRHSGECYKSSWLHISRLSVFSQAFGDIIPRCWFSTEHFPLPNLGRDEVAVHSTVYFPSSRSAGATISQSIFKHEWKEGTYWFQGSHHSNVWMGLGLCRCRMWELHWAEWVWFRSRWLFLCWWNITWNSHQDSVSPPQEHIAGAQWWTDYQPVSYNIVSKRGDRTQFQKFVFLHALFVALSV